MKAARALRWARRRAGLTQRSLSEKTNIPQSTIARIEAGTVDPRLGTLNRLLHACGFDLEVEPLLGIGIDRTLIRTRLALTPAERLAHVAEEALLIQMFKAAVKTKRSPTDLRDSEESLNPMSS